jgi:hypothetical protein
MLRPVTSRSSCQNSQVTGNSTIEHEGNQINVVTGTCSPPSGKRSTLAERQYSLCTEGTCECFPHSQLRVELLGESVSTENVCAGTVTCSQTSFYTIYGSDCQYVLNYLSYYSSKLPNLNPVQTVLFLTTISFGSGYTVVIPSFSYQEWYYGTCAVWFWNFDLYDYDVCVAEIVSAIQLM